MRIMRASADGYQTDLNINFFDERPPQKAANAHGLLSVPSVPI
jgi:hypothetical protein